MTTVSTRPREDFLHLQMSEFWSGDLGLTLVTISLVILVFVITPLREAGLQAHFVFGLIIVGLMIFGALSVQQSRLGTLLVVGFVVATAIFLAVARFQPTKLMHELGSILSTITLLLYVRIVLVVMFRTGPIRWSRIQGGVSAYLLLGMAWASAFQVVEQFRPGSFHFVTAPRDFDQLIAKLTYVRWSCPREAPATGRCLSATSAKCRFGKPLIASCSTRKPDANPYCRAGPSSTTPPGRTGRTPVCRWWRARHNRSFRISPSRTTRDGLWLRFQRARTCLLRRMNPRCLEEGPVWRER